MTPQPQPEGPSVSCYSFKTPKKIREQNAAWRKKSRWKNRKWRADPQFRRKHRLRDYLRRMMLLQKPCNHMTKYVGMGSHKLREYIESIFEPGMSWDNYGRSGWELDHIKPLRDFDLTDERQVAICFHYSNLRPRWWHQNR